MVLYLRRLEFINSVVSAMIGGNDWCICGVILIRGGGIDFFGVGLFVGFLFICVGGPGALMSRYTSVVWPFCFRVVSVLFGLISV